MEQFGFTRGDFPSQPWLYIWHSLIPALCILMAQLLNLSHSFATLSFSRNAVLLPARRSYLQQIYESAELSAKKVKKKSSKLLTANYLSNSCCQLFQTQTNVSPHWNVQHTVPKRLYRCLWKCCRAGKINHGWGMRKKTPGKQQHPGPRFTINIPTLLS